MSQQNNAIDCISSDNEDQISIQSTELMRHSNQSFDSSAESMKERSASIDLASPSLLSKPLGSGLQNNVPKHDEDNLEQSYMCFVKENKYDTQTTRINPDHFGGGHDLKSQEQSYTIKQPQINSKDQPKTVQSISENLENIQPNNQKNKEKQIFEYQSTAQNSPDTIENKTKPEDSQIVQDKKEEIFTLLQQELLMHSQLYRTNGPKVSVENEKTIQKSSDDVVDQQTSQQESAQVEKKEVIDNLQIQKNMENQNDKQDKINSNAFESTENKHIELQQIESQVIAPSTHQTTLKPQMPKLNQQPTQLPQAKQENDYVMYFIVIWFQLIQLLINSFLYYQDPSVKTIQCIILNVSVATLPLCIYFWQENMKNVDIIESILLFMFSSESFNAWR